MDLELRLRCGRRSRNTARRATAFRQCALEGIRYSFGAMESESGLELDPDTERFIVRRDSKRISAEEIKSNAKAWIENRVRRRADLPRSRRLRLGSGFVSARNGEVGSVS